MNPASFVQLLLPSPAAETWMRRLSAKRSTERTSTVKPHADTFTADAALLTVRPDDIRRLSNGPPHRLSNDSVIIVENPEDMIVFRALLAVTKSWSLDQRPGRLQRSTPRDSARRIGELIADFRDLAVFTSEVMQGEAKKLLRLLLRTVLHPVVLCRSGATGLPGQTIAASPRKTRAPSLAGQTISVGLRYVAMR